MSSDIGNDNLIPDGTVAETRAHDETVASQEEIYLEKTAQKLEAILISEDPSAYAKQETVCVDCCSVAHSLDGDLEHAAADLITGDSDDPPLSESDIAEVLDMTSRARQLSAWDKLETGPSNDPGSIRHHGFMRARTASR